MIRMQVPAPQWLQQTPQGISYAQPTGAAVFTNAIRPNPFERLGQHNQWNGMAGHAGDTGLLALAPASTTSVVQNNTDPAWQRSLDIDPTVGPQAGPMMLFDAGIAQGQEMTATAAPRWVIQTSPTGQKTATMVSTNTMGVQRNMAQTTSSGTSATRVNTNPLTEPPIVSQTPPPKPTQNTTPSGDGSDGGGVTYAPGGGIVDGGSALRDYWEQKHKEEMAAQQAAMLAAEQQEQAAMAAAAAKAQAELSRPSWMPLILGGAVIAGLAWWATSGSSGSQKKEG
jgi:hypothetical protein